MSFIGPIIALGRSLIGEAVIDQVLSAIFGGNSGAAIKAAENDIQALARLDVGLSKVIYSLSNSVDQLWVTVHELGADEKKGWLGSANTQRAIGSMIDSMSKDFSGAIINMVDSYVPNSITNLNNHIYQVWIKDLQNTVGQLINRLAHDEGDIFNLQFWKRDTVDPDLKRLDQFLSFWNTYPVQVVAQLHQWIQAPDSWADFLMHSIVTRMTAYGLDGTHQPSTDDLLRMVWTRSPDVFRYVEDAATAILLTPQ